MKLSTVFAALAVTLVAGYTSAASLVVTEDLDSFPGLDVYAVSLDLGADSGLANTFELNITPSAGDFQNLNPTGAAGFTPLGPLAVGETYVSAFLAAPPAFGGLGYSVLTPLFGATQITTGGGPLGGTIDTPPAPVGPVFFLANIAVPDGGAGTFDLSLTNAGAPVANVSAPYGPVSEIPEPTTFGLVGLAVAAFGGLRRRS